MGKRVDREGPIHRSCIAYLEAALPGAVVFHPSNEIPLQGKQVARAIAKAKWNGTRPGYPDIIAHWQGHTMLFEVKAEGNYLSPAQRDMRDELEAQSIPYAVVRSVDDVVETLAAWGVRSSVTNIPLRGVIT